MRKFTSSIPNLLTTLNLVAGSLAIVFAAEGRLGYAGIIVLIAALFDFLDGLAARVLNASSDIGKQLDSLADVISFGVAPGMIAFILMKRSLTGLNMPLTEINTSVWHWILILSPFLLPAFSAWRLAKFNIDPRQTDYFLGMPTPASAMLWSSFGIITDFTVSPEIPILLFTPQNLLIVIIITSLLMVSELPMISLKFKDLNFRNNWYRYVFLLTSLLLLIIMGIYGMTIIIFLYIAFSISFYMFKIRL